MLAIPGALYMSRRKWDTDRPVLRGIGGVGGLRLGEETLSADEKTSDVEDQGEGC